jgi:hypothetical protein
MAEISAAFLVAVGAAQVGRPTLAPQAKEAARPALDGTPRHWGYRRMDNWRKK